MGNLSSEAAQRFATERDQYPAVQQFQCRDVKYRIVAADGWWGAQVELPYPARDAQFDRPEGFYVWPRDRLLLVQPLTPSLHHTPYPDVVAAAELVATSQRHVPPLRVADIVAGLRDDLGLESCASSEGAWRAELFRTRPAPVAPGPSGPLGATTRVVAACPSLGDRLLAVLTELKTLPEADLPAFTAWCGTNALPLFGLTTADLTRLWTAVVTAP